MTLASLSNSYIEILDLNSIIISSIFDYDEIDSGGEK